MHNAFMIAASMPFMLAASASGSIVAISLGDVTVDGSLPDSIRDAFDDDDGRLLKSASVDLDGDGIAEKFVPNEFLCGNGGCPWVMYSVTQKRVIGTVFGSTLVVESSSIEGYKILNVSFSEGANQVVTQKYAFINGYYRTTT
jgi:hypothetical protein